MNTFKDFNLSEQLMNTIEKLGFNSPTEIQSKSIPLIMEGKDVIGESATGSGKTLAFGCGIIDHVTTHGGLQALVLTPTRELAEQVKDALLEISRQKPLFIISVYGGVAINPQIRDLSRANVVVATPGRFLDHLQRRTVNTSKIKILVLDEADRMLDMGFIDDVEKIIKSCPPKRQNMLFSATISSRIAQLANRYMSNPTKITAERMVDPDKLKQVYYDSKRDTKLSLLVHLLQHENSELVMVFSNTRRNTDFVVKNLRVNKIDAIAIHGGLTQNRRGKTIKSFNKGEVGVLVCTDVAARGLDINNVSHIYNYDIPIDPIDYIHRIGRTARAGEEGKAINLLCEMGHTNFRKILSKYKSFKIEKAEIPEFKKIYAVKNDDRHDDFRKSSGRKQSYHGHKRKSNRSSHSRRY